MLDSFQMSTERSATQQARRKEERTAEASGFNSLPDLVKPIGVLDSEQSSLTVRRYADSQKAWISLVERKSSDSASPMSKPGSLRSVRRIEALCRGSGRC